MHHHTKSHRIIVKLFFRLTVNHCIPYTLFCPPPPMFCESQKIFQDCYQRRLMLTSELRPLTPAPPLGLVVGLCARAGGNVVRGGGPNPHRGATPALVPGPNSKESVGSTTAARILGISLHCASSSSCFHFHLWQFKTPFICTENFLHWAFAQRRWRFWDWELRIPHFVDFSPRCLHVFMGSECKVCSFMSRRTETHL